MLNNVTIYPATAKKSNRSHKQFEHSTMAFETLFYVVSWRIFIEKNISSHLDDRMYIGVTLQWYIGEKKNQC